MEKKVLYVGGFQLPNKNAAALRVMGNAKALKKQGFNVYFINALIECNTLGIIKKKYDEFVVYEYKRENQSEYLFRINRIVAFIKKIKPTIVIAYNYPGIALNKLRKYCHRHGIKCYADATEWYKPAGNLIFRLIKGFDTELRMRYVQCKMDGVIAISRYLYLYYKDKVLTINVPPLVDLTEKKWKVQISKVHEGVKLLYAGTPSEQKERLDLIVKAVEGVSSNIDLHMDVIGVTREQFNVMYGSEYVGTRINFMGRISNEQVIKKTKEADWVVVLREKNRVVEAGFPTKVSEAISCGTPVLANKFSNIEDYLNEENSFLIETIMDFDASVIEEAIRRKMNVKEDLFDYHRYESEFGKLLNR